MEEEDMVERVARRLYRHEWRERPPGHMTAEEAPYWREAARAAIEAMREPTPAMKEVGSGFPVTRDLAGDIWEVMVAAALSPTGRGGGV